MKKWLKTHFIPHEDNEYLPHFFRARNVIALAAVILLFFVGALLQRIVVTQTNLAAVISSVLVDLTNRDRVEYQSHPLVINNLLVDAAQRKANDMAAKSYFAHISPEGLQPWHWIQEAGYKFSYAGENLAVRFSDSEEVERAWMESPTHRANVLNENFTEIGIATARGQYKGQATTFVVQMFGRPALAQAPADIAPVDTAPVAVVSPEIDVLGVSQPEEEGVEVLAESEMFIAVKNTTPLSDEVEGSALLGSAEVPSYASRFEEILTSPKQVLYYVYLALALLILVALATMVFVEIRRQHVRHIVYALSLLVLLNVLFLGGQVFLFPEVVIGLEPAL